MLSLSLSLRALLLDRVTLRRLPLCTASAVARRSEALHR